GIGDDRVHRSILNAQCRNVPIEAAVGNGSGGVDPLPAGQFGRDDIGGDAIVFVKDGIARTVGGIPDDVPWIIHAGSTDGAVGRVGSPNEFEVVIGRGNA